ncbi:MAG: 50S ribosomal protein L24 [Flavobacteriales bacterium]|nr:50S ribosomal protein L24 [Flavobacteriales bacterium]
MYKRVKVKKGDQVRVLSGEHKGSEGSVLEVIRATDRVLIEGVNIVTKHVKPNANNPQGGVEKKEAPIHISNVQVIDKQGNATRVGRRRADNGKLVRYSKKSNEEL